MEPYCLRVIADYRSSNRSRLPVIQFTVEKDKTQKRIMGSAAELRTQVYI